MYKRNNRMFKTFEIHQRKNTIVGAGTAKLTYEPTTKPPTTIKGKISASSAYEQAQWKQAGHPVTHTIVQDGPRKAKEGDALVLGDRVFLIQTIDDPGALGEKTVYRCEEKVIT